MGGRWECRQVVTSFAAHRDTPAPGPARLIDWLLGMRSALAHLGSGEVAHALVTVQYVQYGPDAPVHTAPGHLQ